MVNSEVLSIIVSVKDQASRSIQGITSNLTGMQKAALMAGSALAVMGLKSAISTFASFDEQLTNSLSIMGDVNEEMRKEFSDTARTIAKEYGIAGESVAKGYYYLASAGLSAEESLKAINEVAQLSVAAHMDLAEATDLVVGAMKGFGKTVDDLVDINDVLMTTVTKTNTNFAQLGEAMKYLSPVAHAVGWSIEEMSAAVGLLANHNIKGAQAGVYLRQSIARLLDPTNEMKEILTKLGLTYDDVNPKTHSFTEILDVLSKSGAEADDIMRLFGVRAGGAILALIQDGVPALQKFTQELNNAGGTTEEVAEKQMKSFSAQMRVLKETLRDVARTIGEEVAPIIGELATKIKGLLENEESQEKLKTFTEGLKASLQLIVNVISKLIDLLKLIPTPVLKIVGAFSGFLIIIGPLVGLISVVSSLWGIISSGLGVLGSFTGLSASLTGVIGGLSGVLGSLIGVLTAVVSAIGLPVIAIGALIAAIGLLVFNVGGARDKLKEFLGLIKDAFVWAFNQIKEKVIEFASTIYNKALEIGKSILNGVINGLKALPSKLKDALLGPIQNAVNKIKSLLGLHSPSKVFEDIGKNIVKGYEEGLNTAKKIKPILPAPQIALLSPATASSSGGSNITINLDGVAIREDKDIDKLANEIEKRLVRRLKW